MVATERPAAPETGELPPLARLARARHEALRPAERRVTEHLLTLDPTSPSATAAAVAMALGVSQATVVNTVQRLGYAGFGDFRRRFIAERAVARVNEPAATPAAQADPLAAIRQRVFAEDAAALELTAQMMDGAAFRAAATILASAPQVLCIGTGWSGVLARFAAGTFTKYGIRATGEELGIEQMALVEVVDPATALLVVSHRGRAPDLLAAVERALARGIRVVALTHRSTSPLARAATIALVCAGAALEEGIHPNQTGGPPTHLTAVRALAEAVAWLQANNGHTPPETGRYKDGD